MRQSEVKGGRGSSGQRGLHGLGWHFCLVFGFFPSFSTGPPVLRRQFFCKCSLWFPGEGERNKESKSSCERGAGNTPCGSPGEGEWNEEQSAAVAGIRQRGGAGELGASVHLGPPALVLESELELDGSGASSGPVPLPYLYLYEHLCEHLVPAAIASAITSVSPYIFLLPNLV